MLIQSCAMRGTSLQVALVLAVLVSACTAVGPAEPVSPTAAVEPSMPAIAPVAVIQPTVGATAAPQAAGSATDALSQTALATPTALPTTSEDIIRSPDVATATTLLAVQFESALNHGDVEGALAMFLEGAEVKIPPDVYVGDAQIRGWLEYLAANNFAAEPGFRHSTGDRVTWPLAVRSDYLESPGAAIARGRGDPGRA